MPAPLLCERCGSHLKAKRWGKANRFCSLACYHASPRKPIKASVKGRRMRTAKGHPLAGKTGVVALARLALYDKIGPGEHACHWCRDSVAWMPGRGLANGALLADHLDHDKDNNSAENLVPSCNACNAHRTRTGERRRIEDDELTVMWSGVRTRAVERNCEHCGSEFLTIPAQVELGRGRFCSRSCARKGPRP